MRIVKANLLPPATNRQTKAWITKIGWVMGPCTRKSAAVPLRAQVSYEHNEAAQAKRLNAAARCMAVYQQGMLTLHKLRQNGQQRITVQYVNVSNGSQAVIRNIKRNTGTDMEPKAAISPV